MRLSLPREWRGFPLPSRLADAFIPPLAVVPFEQEKDCRCRVVARKGDAVGEGQILAMARPAQNGEISSSVHSPAPGVIEDIAVVPCPDGTMREAAIIRAGGKFSYLGKKRRAVDWTLFSGGQILEMLSDKGVSNGFEPGDPRSLSSCASRSIMAKKSGRLLVARLFDCDTACLASEALAALFPREIREGALITARALGAEGIAYVADSKSGFSIPNDGRRTIPEAVFRARRSDYRSGFSKELRAAIKKSAPSAPFSGVSSGDLFVDAAALLAARDAVMFGKPFIDVFVLVSGGCVKASALLRARLGTPLRFLAEQCGGFVSEPGSVVVNGAMLGSAPISLEAPVTKGVKSVAFLPRSSPRAKGGAPCSRCGECRAVCPRALSPDLLFFGAAGGGRAKGELSRSALLCSGCALCAAVCEARLPLAQTIVSLREGLLGKRGVDS